MITTQHQPTYWGCTCTRIMWSAQDSIGNSVAFWLQDDHMTRESWYPFGVPASRPIDQRTPDPNDVPWQALGLELCQH